MKILFAASPDFVYPVLEFLACEHELAAVLTNAPRQSGRGKKMHASPLLQHVNSVIHTEHKNFVDTSAERVVEKLSRVKIIEADTIDETVYAEVQALDCDLLVCYAFGKMFTEKFLSLFRYGGINIHPSLLPRWRGASPVPAAILHGDTITGVSIQTLVKKMDAGKILAAASYPLNDRENAGEVLVALTEKSVGLLRRVLADFPLALKNAQPQDESAATYCTKLRREKINWNNSALQIARTVLALTPNPKAFSSVAGERITLTKVSVLDTDKERCIEAIEKNAKNGKIVGVDKDSGILVQTAQGLLAIERLQREGKKEMPWKDFLNGYGTFLECAFDNEI